MIDELQELLRLGEAKIFRTMLHFETHTVPVFVKTAAEDRKRIIGSEAVTQECKNYEETKDWRFMNTFEEATSALN
jgi:hypothetical protein